MKIRPNHFLGALLCALSVSHHANADMFDIDGTTAGFGVVNGSTYDWWASNVWAATPNDTGTAATATWVNGSRQAFFVGAGSGTSYIVRLGSSGSTATTLQNIALNVNAAATGALSGAAGDVTIGNTGDTGVLTLNAANSIGTYAGTLTINNPINLNAKTMNFRGGNIVINGAISGTGVSKIAIGGGSAFGYTTSGPGTLTLANTGNTYAGRTATEYITTNFTLAVTKLANGGSNSSIGTSSANIGINGGTLKYIGSTGAQSTNLGLHIASGGATIDASGVTSSDTIAISGTPTFSAANQAGNLNLTGSNLGENTMAFAFNNNGTTATALNKTGAGRWVINQANGYTGGTNANGGTLVAANVSAFGTAGRTINFNTGTIEFATDTTANAYVLNVGSGNTGTVVINRATAGTNMTHVMGTATIGNSTLNIQKGANVSGDGILEFGGINMSAGVAGLITGTMLNPTTAKALVSGNITRSGGSANLLTLDGTSTGNVISGIISGSQALTKSNTSDWTLSNANTFTGNTKVTGGSLILKNNLALQASAFDTSGEGTLDLTDASITAPTLGGIIGDVATGQDFVLPSGVTGLTLNPAATATYVKNISGGSAGLTLTKTGTGTQVLGGTNTYSGLTTVNGGELRITNAGAIGGSNVTVTSGQLTLDGGITVSGKSLTTSGSGSNFIGGLQSISGTNEWAGSVTLGADLSRIGARKNATLAVSGVIDDGASTYSLVIRNENFTLNNNGAGNPNTVTVLSGVSTYGGNTQLISGITKLDGGNDRLPTSTILQFGLATTNAKFDMNGRNQEVAGLAVTSSGTDANRDWNANELTNSSGTLSTLTINTTANQNFGVASTNNTGIITGNIAIVKSGSAVLTLSGTNTYTNNTTISAGTLSLSGAGSISNSAVISLESSSSKFNITGVTTSAAIGAGASNQLLKGIGTVEVGAKILSIGANGTLAPGNSPGTLTFDIATGGTLDFATGSEVSFELGSVGLGSDLISFSSTGNWLTGSGNATLALSLLSGFDYTNTYNIFENVNTTGFDFAAVTGYDTTNYTHTFVKNGTNYQLSFAPVPESSTALLGMLGGIALLRRRRK